MDNDAGDKAWLLTDPRFMLWREPETAAGRRFRCFADTGGSYLHAPFVFRVPKEALTSHKLSLEAEHGAVPGDQVRIEAFDGRGYHLVGVLEPGRGWRSQHWPLPQTITGRRPEHPEPAEASPGIRRGAGILPLPVGGPAPDPNLGVDEAAGPSQAEPAAAQQVESLVQQRGFDGVVEVVLRQRAVDRFYSDWAEFLAITLADGQGRAKVVFGPGESLQITVRAAVRMPLPVCELALAIYSMSNVVIATAAWPLPGGLTVGEHEWTMSIERPNLRQQEYLVSAALVREAPRATNERVQFYCRWNRSLSFRVEEGLVGNLPVGLVNLEMNPPSGAPLVPGRIAKAATAPATDQTPETPKAFAAAVIQALGSGPPRNRPGNLQSVSEEQIDDVLLREYTYINGFGEAVGLTIAEPPQRRFAEPVLAIHQTNDVGRRELFGLDGDPDLAFGLELARRGHRVLAHDLFMTGDRSERHWDKAAFYAAHPDWSMTGKMIADLQDLLEVMAAELGETGAVDVIGHSQGGVVAYFLAALEPRIRRAACNACYFGQPASGDPWDSQIYTSQTLNEARRGWCLGAHLDRLIALAARQRDLLLVCYRQDHILTDPLPQGRELENMKHWAANPHVRLLDGRHAFPEVVREAAYGFLETGRFSLAPAEART